MDYGFLINFECKEKWETIKKGIYIYFVEYNV